MIKVITIVLVGIITIISNYWIVKKTGSQAYLSEVSQFSNIHRCRALRELKDRDTVLVGSSITGRLLPSFFNSADQGKDSAVINLGIDGGTTSAGLSYLRDSDVLPRVIFVELNTLQEDGYEKSLYDLRNEFGTQGSFTSKVEMLSPLYRPSSVLYFLAKKNAEQSLILNAEKRDSYDDQLLGEDKLSKDISFFLEKDVLIFFIDIPSGNPPSYEAVKFAEGLAKDHVNIKFLNRERSLSLGTLKYTDGIHLDLASARLIANMISHELEIL